MKTARLIPFVGIAIFVYLIYKIGLESITSVIFKFNSTFYWAFLLVILLMLLQLYKWNLFLKKQGIHLPFWLLFKIMSIGNFYGFITPAQLGAFVRANYIKKYSSHSTAEVFPSVFIERLLDLLAVFVLALAGMILVLKDFSGMLALILSLFILASIATIFIVKRKGIRLLLHIIEFLAPRRLFIHVNNFVDLFYKKMFRIRDLVYPIIITVLYWAAIFTSSYVIAVSYGLKIPWFDFVSIFAIATLVGVIPITASGLGTREATLLFLLSNYGSSPEVILAMSITALLLFTALPAFIGILFLLREV